MQRLSGQRGVRVEASGMRTQVIALTAVALGPGVFSEVLVSNGVQSLRHLLDAPVEQRAAPELFCLDLYKRFDIDALAKLGSKGIIRADAVEATPAGLAVFRRQLSEKK